MILWNKIREDKEERKSFSKKEAPLSLIGSFYKGTIIEKLVRSMPKIEFEDAKSEVNTLATLHYPLFKESMKQNLT